MNNVKKMIATIIVAGLVTIMIDLALRAEEEGTCSTSSEEWCGMMYLDRLADAQEELASCQAQNPQEEHADHDDGCMHSHCDDSRDSFTNWVVPANSYLLRRSELSDEDYKLQVLLAEHIGGTPDHWPLPVETMVKMGYIE